MKRFTLITRYVQKLYGMLLLTMFVFGACSPSANPLPDSGDSRTDTTETEGTDDPTTETGITGDPTTKPKVTDDSGSPVTPRDACFTVVTGVITVFDPDQDDCFYKNIVIPNNIAGQDIIEIGASVFNSLGLSIDKKFTHITLPDTLQKIGTKAFFFNRIKTILIPDSVQEIGGGAFSNNQLTGLNLGNSVTTIGNSAFSSNQLTELDLGNSVTTIGYSAFSSNPLTTVHITPHERLSFESDSFPSGTSLKNGFDGQDPKQTGTWIFNGSTSTWGFTAAQ